MMLSATAIDLIEQWRLGFVATVSAGGRPNVSPKGTFIVVDQHTLAFGEIRSPQTVTNLSNNPEVEINFLNQFTRKGLRVRGQAQIVRQGVPEFDALFPKFQTLWADLADRINLIVKIPVDSVKPLSSPPYDDGMTEDQFIAIYKQKFAEMYP